MLSVGDSKENENCRLGYLFWRGTVLAHCLSAFVALCHSNSVLTHSSRDGRSGHKNGEEAMGLHLFFTLQLSDFCTKALHTEL